VIRIVPPGTGRSGTFDLSKDILARSRKFMIVDLKQPPGVEAVRDLCKTADGLIEGFRPGVMERLGLGPEPLLKDNAKLVYGRMTGWGQSGPRAHTAGHDINYIALSGVLDCVGRSGDKPTPPVNLIGDFGGGGMLLAFGMLAAILHAEKTGEGQVIDCAMVEGSALLASMIWSLVAQGVWSDKRGNNMLDTGATVDGVMQPRPAPRFSATAAADPVMAKIAEGTDSSALLRAIGYSDERIESLRASGAVS
jgi:alpha-methylacyl-CoA racemase